MKRFHEIDKWNKDGVFDEASFSKTVLNDLTSFEENKKLILDFPSNSTTTEYENGIKINKCVCPHCKTETPNNIKDNWKNSYIFRDYYSERYYWQNYSYSIDIFECPVCKKKSIRFPASTYFSSSSTLKYSYVNFVEEFDDFYSIVGCSLVVNKKDESSDTFITLKVNPKCVYFYLKKDKRAIKINNSIYSSMEKVTYKKTPFTSSDITNEFVYNDAFIHFKAEFKKDAYIPEEMAKSSSTPIVSTRKLSKKEVEKADLFEKINALPKTDDVFNYDEHKSVIMKHMTSFAVIKNRKDGIQTSVVNCSCGHYYEKKTSVSDKQITTICPHCGQENISDVRTIGSTIPRYRLNVNSFVFYEAFENCLVKRKIYVDAETTIDGVQFKIVPNAEVDVFTPANVIYRRQKDTEDFTPLRKNATNFKYEANNCICLNSKEELIDIISQTGFSKCGLIEAWHLNSETPSHISLCDPGYLAYYMLHPFIEYVSKCNLDNLVDDLLYYSNKIADSNIIDPKATNIKDILKVPKADFKVIREKNMSFDEFSNFKAIRALDVNSTYDDYRFFTDEQKFSRGMFDHIINSLKEIVDITNCPLKKIEDYLELTYLNQCIEYYEAINVWTDYLRMGKRLHYNFKDKTLLYPSSLKKEHDIAVFAYNALSEKIKAEMFEEVVKTAKKFEFESKELGLTVVIPETPEDIVAEGKLQKHCVASYVNKMSEGVCFICFIRKTSDITKPYYTVEISPSNHIVQVRGFCNANPTTDVIEFVKRWAKNKNLSR